MIEVYQPHPTHPDYPKWFATVPPRCLLKRSDRFPSYWVVVMEYYGVTKHDDEVTANVAVINHANVKRNSYDRLHKIARRLNRAQRRKDGGDA